MGISPQAVSRWETGVTSPDISALPVLAGLFGITVDELLGVNDKEKLKEISSVIAAAEAKIDKNITEEPIIKLREALKKYPNNDRLLTCLMYALYAASEDDELCREFDSEIVSIYARIQKYSTDNYCRNESLRLLFRHYCDTNRFAEAKQLTESMAGIETCYEVNIYWALDNKERPAYLKKRISDDLRDLLWSVWAYSVHAELDENEKQKLDTLRADIEEKVKNSIDLN
ncbi:MAG: helix-turn-helix transcriptional regulator [Clostridia bacterium]|nr:helix-turn-helix transcriptional regulator [Clostridia bacterium]